MNIETCISIVAAFFYSQFIEKLKENEGKEIPYESINLTRYTDWFITTPLMLLVLCLVLGLEHNIAVKFTTYFIIILLNFGMLAAGYLGEIKKLDKKIALTVGFVFFFVMFWIIYSNFMIDNSSFGANLSFFIFFVFWSIYGAIYLTKDKTKNIVFNVLDLIAKAIVGIFFWMYFTKSVIF
jgi:bacteriorhodopsin